MMMMILVITKQIQGCQGCKAQRKNPLIVMMMMMKRRNFLLLLISFTRFKRRVA
jgi:hypothetical protein